MGHALQAAPGGLVYHAFDRANGRPPLFEQGGDDAAFRCLEPFLDGVSNEDGTRLKL